MLLNLGFDLTFFFLLLQVGRDEKLRKKMYLLSAVCLFVIFVLATYEVFFGGIVDHAYDNYRRFYFRDSIYQFPVVFYSNTNDLSAIIVFMLAALTLGGFFWRCDTWTDALLSAFATGWTYFLLRASSSRLCLLSYWIFFAGIVAASLFKRVNRKQRFVCIILALACVLVIELEHRGIYNQSINVSLADEFFEYDEYNNKILNETSSAGVRTRLIMHTFRCFWESRGLGVGLGNTGQLALIRKVASSGNKVYYESIHCFIARLFGDYGIFIAIPMIAIGFLLLRSGIRAIRLAKKTNDGDLFAETLLFFSVLIFYPIVSTASSDAQDLIPMWYYLAVVIWTSDRLSGIWAGRKHFVI